MIRRFSVLESTRAAGFTLIELMCVVAIGSALATVAVPTFLNYVKKAKTIEAGVNLRNIYDAQVSHYYRLYTKADRNGNLVFDIASTSCSWSTGPNCWCFTYSNAYSNTGPMGTPPSGTKEVLRLYPDPNGAGASYDANPYDYYKSFPTLGVAFDAPSAFAYRVALGVAEVSSLLYTPGRTSYQSFYAEAYGDLDGDGVKSTFRRIGYVDPNTEVVGGGGLYIQDGLE